MKPFAWSYSALTDWEGCPRRYAEVKLFKNFAQTFGAEASEGQKHHESLEKALGAGAPLPAGLVDRYPLTGKICTLLTAQPGARQGALQVEQKVGITRDLTPCGFFDRGVWGRAVFDVALVQGDTVSLYDHKFGKVKEDLTQLHIFALFASVLHPEAQRFNVRFIWYQTGQVVGANLTREDLPALWQDVLGRVRRMEEAVKEGTFPARPSGLCRRHCPVLTCPHNGGYS
jgi:hypothetical protein